MKNARTIILRLLLSGIFAFVVARIFFNDISTTRILGLGAVLFGFAYLFEYVRKRDRGGG